MQASLVSATRASRSMLSLVSVQGKASTSPVTADMSFSSSHSFELHGAEDL